MPLNLNVGDTVELKKQHACGCKEFQIIRVGMDIKIKCKNYNSDEELYDELQTIIDLGGRVKDVIVEHPTYGVLKAELNVSTNRDLKKFMEKATTNEFKQLSVLSPDYHIHTIEVSNKDIFEEIKKELSDKNI